MTDLISPTIHEIAELGPRPHNPSARELNAHIARASGELALLMIKPGFYPNHPDDGAPIQAEMETRVAASGLDVLCTAEARPSALDVCELYRNVLPPNPEDDAQWGVDWKKGLIRYISTGAVFSYLLEGGDAFKHAQAIKNELRGRYAKNQDTQIIRNVAHAPDPEDFDISLDILFKGGLSAHSLEESRTF